MLRIARIAHDVKEPGLITFLLNKPSFFRIRKRIVILTTGTFHCKVGFSVQKGISGPKGTNPASAEFLRKGAHTDI